MELQQLFDNSMVFDWIMLGLFFAAFLIQLGYYLLVFLKLPPL